MKKSFIPILLLIVLAVTILNQIGKGDSKDEWHNSDGSDIICRVVGCGGSPLHSDWSNRFCAEHLDKSTDYSSSYNSSVAKKKTNYESALTKEQADALRGTGYNGTRPNSSAENSELAAAMVKCKNCGMRSHNGVNSLCYECQYNKEHGFD